MDDAALDPVPVAIALGSNLGNRGLMLREAVNEMLPYLTIITKSPVYETEPAYVTSQSPFYNAAITGLTKLPPLTLLWSLKYIEGQMGRQPTFRYGPRVIDLDILFYGNTVFHDSELIVPHPRMAEREFVLRPLADIAGDWRHPETGATVADMLEALPEHTARRTSEKL